MSSDLLDHIRYPEDLFTIQSDMYRDYHMIDPRVFYADEDPWVIPSDSSTTPRVATLRGEFTEIGFKPMLPYYLLMSLPGESDLSYLIFQPFYQMKNYYFQKKNLEDTQKMGKFLN